jgi:hypothetical protein
MEAIDLWKLHGEFSVYQTAMLSIGQVPEERSGTLEQGLVPTYNAVEKLLLANIGNKELNAELQYFSYEGVGEMHTEIDIYATRINRKDIITFYKKIDFFPEFFFSAQLNSRGYLDSKNEFYAPKLAAAVAAWEAVTSNESLLSGKTPKQALEKWLHENAALFSLIREDGSPNEFGIEETAKVANWKPEGGVAKTPTRVPQNPPTPKTSKKQ